MAGNLILPADECDIFGPGCRPIGRLTNEPRACPVQLSTGLGPWGFTGGKSDDYEPLGTLWALLKEEREKKRPIQRRRFFKTEPGVAKMESDD